MARSRRRRRSQATLHGPRKQVDTTDLSVTPDKWWPLVWNNEMDFHFKILTTNDHNGVDGWRRTWVNLNYG